MSVYVSIVFKLQSRAPALWCPEITSGLTIFDMVICDYLCLASSVLTRLVALSRYIADRCFARCVWEWERIPLPPVANASALVCAPTKSAKLSKKHKGRSHSVLFNSTSLCSHNLKHKDPILYLGSRQWTRRSASVHSNRGITTSCLCMCIHQAHLCLSIKWFTFFFNRKNTLQRSLLKLVL